MKNIRLFKTQLDLSAGEVIIPQNSNGDEDIVISSFEFNVLSTINIDVQYSIDGINFTTLYSGISNTEKRRGGLLWRKMKFIKNSGSTSVIGINYAQGLSANANTPDASSTGDAESNPVTTRTGALSYAYNNSTWDRVRAGITALTTTVTGWLNVLPSIRYNATLPNATEGQFGVIQGDQNMRIWQREGYASRAENNPLGVIQTLNLPLAAADGSWTGFKNLGANATLNMKAAAGNLHSLYCRNKSGSAGYIMVFNTATTPAGGAVPDFVFLVPAGSTTVVGNDFFGLNGFWFSNGMAFAWSTTETTYTAGTASDHTTHALIK